MDRQLPITAWLVHSGRAFVNKVFISEDQAKRSIEERKDGAQLEPMVKLSDAIAYAEEAVKQERERAITSESATEVKDPPQQDTTWCAYIAGMIETYLQQSPAADVREKGIAGIIERRLCFLAIRARSGGLTPREVQGEAIPGSMRMVNGRLVGPTLCDVSPEILAAASRKLMEDPAYRAKMLDLSARSREVQG